MSAPARCAECKKKPGKPKFCSKSCAAKFNNRKVPKRGPEGNCVDCSAPIPKACQRCDECKAKRAEAERKRRENVQTLRTPAGEVIERAVPRASVHRATVFEPRPFVWKKLSPTDTIGEFLDALLGVVFARPEYIRPDDVHRYAAWIEALRGHTREWEWRSTRTRGPVGSLPLRRLEFALEVWAKAVMTADENPLFSTFALDATEFIAAHAYGSYHSAVGGYWQISQMVTPGPGEEWSEYRRFPDQRFKRELTMRLKGTLTRCEVPPGGSIPGLENRLPALAADESFVFAVERCHLTQPSGTDWVSVRAMESNPPPFDITADFWFRGRYLYDAATGRPMTHQVESSDSQTVSRWEYLVVEIPVRWIVDVYQWDEQARKLQPIPVPSWTG